MPGGRRFLATKCGDVEPDQIAAAAERLRLWTKCSLPRLSLRQQN
jgi:cAMP phosphodiesterase